MTKEQAHTILVIDDEAIIRRNFKGHLEDEGHLALITDDGHEALEMLGRERVDLILVDLRMPKMDGLEVLARVKKTSPDTPVIVVSGTGRLEDAVEALRLGAWDYLLKPVEDMSILTHAIEKSLERARLIRENRDHQQRLEELVADRTEELKAAYAKIEKSEKFLNTIVENIPDMIFVKDAKDLSFISFNKSGEDLLGYNREELIGKNDYDFFPKQEADFFTENDREVLAKGELLDILEEPIQTKHKGQRILHTKKIPIINEKGQPEYLLGISEDITEGKRAEEEKNKLEVQLQQAQKMESIGTLAGGIAHDFNNILSVIMGNAEIVLYDLPEEDPVWYSIDQVVKAGCRAKDLVKQILAFSRQNEPELRPVRVSLIVKEAMKLLRSSLPSTIEIRQKIVAEKDSVMADPTQIHQIQMNLCTNAQHAMQERGGVLDVRLTNIFLDSESAANYPELWPGQFLKLTVSDTGHGMTPEIMEQIFDPYFTSKEKDVGTGLGLSVVDGIVKSCKGSISVRSEPEKGTRFDVLLPCVDMGIETPAQEIEPIPRGTERVMFIDDEAAICDLGKRMLQNLGYRVDIKASAIEALEAFRPHPERYDLIITDMTMPNMTGDQLAKAFLNIRPDIPIILCTGFSERITEQAIKDMGIKGFVMKPLVMREIAELIRNVLDKRD